jgi:hypothetical protein
MLEPSSDEQRRRRENWPRPFGLRRKSGHTSFSSLHVVRPCAADSASSDLIFACNAARPNSVNGPNG